MPIKDVTGSPSCKKKDAIDAYDKSIEILEKITNELKLKNLTENQFSLIKKYLKISDIPGNIDTIINIFEKTLNGLKNNDITINVSYFNFANPSEKTKINIAIAQFNNKKQLIRYMIHEASHIYADTKDFGDFGYIKNNGEFKIIGIDESSAIINADSYAVLAVLSFGIELS